MSNGQLILQLEKAIEAGDMLACLELLGWEDWRKKDEYYIAEDADDPDEVCTIFVCKKCPWSTECNKQAFGRKVKMCSRRSPEEVLQKLQAHGISGGYHEFSRSKAEKAVEELDIDSTIDHYEETYDDRQRYSFSVSCAHAHQRVAHVADCNL